MRAASRWSAMGLVAWTGLMGCASDPRARMMALEQENARLTQATQAADEAVRASAEYSEELQSPAKAGNTFSLYYAPATLEQAASRMVPYRMPGRDFHSKLAGDIVVERLTDFRPLSRNRLACRAHLRGDNVRYTGKVPSFAKGQVRDFERAVAAGAVADLEVQLTLEGSSVQARAQAVQARFNSKEGAGYERQLTDEMNQRALRLPLVFDLSIQGTSATPRRLMVTGNHVIVTYTP
ncbi:hypothetical protein KRR26_10650 [Corallococcus sp. M34]|uniref:hypothetical protein n=1 Tax=Citreicoccus inhibens TaxID=2849499 RepID=UPI0011C42E16|nr:hypothetical protein [Citreicoccus inhibens]MBU8896067.1 hypothetical protein [Citreicoccus inhibens]